MYRVDCSRYAISRPHSRTLVNRLEACSHARCTPPSWATESSPYSKKTRWYSSSARLRPTVASMVESPVVSSSPTNSSRNSRRRLLWVREYRAKSAPFTTSGRLTRAKTGWSRFVKYGRRTSASSAVKLSSTYLGMGVWRLRLGGHRGADRIICLESLPGGIEDVGAQPQISDGHGHGLGPVEHGLVALRCLGPARELLGVDGHPGGRHLDHRVDRRHQIADVAHVGAADHPVL